MKLKHKADQEAQMEFLREECDEHLEEMIMDQCKNCVVRGDLEECVKTTCSQHESWFAVEIMKALAKKGCKGIFCVMNNRVCGECPVTNCLKRR